MTKEEQSSGGLPLDGESDSNCNCGRGCGGGGGGGLSSEQGKTDQSASCGNSGDVGGEGLPYKRVLLKLSGEALMGNTKYGISTSVINGIAEQIKEVHDLGVELALVIGGGNIFRGVSAASEGMDRAAGDYVGMLATTINALVFQEALEKVGVDSRVMSAIEMKQLAETYIRRRAERHLEKGRVTIFAAGTGNPFFTTDTAAALRALEIHAELLVKATKVDGVYDSDPMKNPSARKYRQLRYMDVLKQNLKVMDSTAISLCMENNLPLCVFNINRPGGIKAALSGQNVGTVISGGTDSRTVFEDEADHTES